MFDALVLAGSRGGGDAVAAYAGVSDKALIPIGGRTMLACVIDALRRAGANRIVVAVSSQPVCDHATALGVETMVAAAGPSESTARGLTLMGAPILVTTADHPLLAPEWISDFIAAIPEDADVAALLADRQTIERDVPRTRRTYLRFADGAWSGCNLFYLATPRAARIVNFWQSVEADRKRPSRIIRHFGARLLLRYLIGRLSLAAALNRVGAATDAQCYMIPCGFGLAAVDVDKPDDLDLVRRLIC